MQITSQNAPDIGYLNRYSHLLDRLLIQEQSSVMESPPFMAKASLKVQCDSWEVFAINIFYMWIRSTYYNDMIYRRI